jgi:hypothetical protein
MGFKHNSKMMPNNWWYSCPHYFYLYHYFKNIFVIMIDIIARCDVDICLMFIPLWYFFWNLEDFISLSYTCPKSGYNL